MCSPRGFHQYSAAVRRLGSFDCTRSKIFGTVEWLLPWNELSFTPCRSHHTPVNKLDHPDPEFDNGPIFALKDHAPSSSIFPNAPGYSSATFSATSPRTPSMPIIRTLGSASIPIISFPSSEDNPAPDHALVTGASISTHNNSATRRMANRHTLQSSIIALLRLTKTSGF